MQRRFKLDENIPRDAESHLREQGHDVETVLSERLGGSPDTHVIAASCDEERILVTLDLDFADIRRYPPSLHSGVWILRPRLECIDSIVALLRGALTLLDTEPVNKSLWIVEPGRVRIHE